jgi:hypothetical protein
LNWSANQLAFSADVVARVGPRGITSWQVEHIAETGYKFRSVVMINVGFFAILKVYAG